MLFNIEYNHQNPCLIFISKIEYLKISFRSKLGLNLEMGFSVVLHYPINLHSVLG